jgi:tetratricopeptide (TPR) repeat protein
VDEQDAQALLELAQAAPGALRGPDAKLTVENLDRRYSELRLATEWFIKEGRPDQALLLSSALVPFWLATKRLDEGLAWLDRVLASPGGGHAHRGRALFDAGYLAFWKGDDGRASELYDQALALGRQTNSPTVTALALVGLARVALRTDVDSARLLCREALSITEGTADREGRSSAMHVLAVAAQMAGDLQEARDMMTRRIALARETGNLATVSMESNNLSMVERQLGNFSEAESLAREALTISSRRGDAMSIAWNLNGLAAVKAGQRDFNRAATLIGAADAAMEAAGGGWPPDELVHYQHTVTTLSETMGPASFDRARSAGRSMSTAEAVEFALQAPSDR